MSICKIVNICIYICMSYIIVNIFAIVLVLYSPFKQNK